MACRISELVLNCRDPSRLAAFWCEVLGYTEFTRDADSIEIGPVGTGFGGLQPTIVFQAHAAPTPGLLRLHFDVSPVGCERDEEVDRILALGATRAYVCQGEQRWVVLADPERNEFCVLGRRADLS